MENRYWPEPDEVARLVADIECPIATTVARRLLEHGKATGELDHLREAALHLQRLGVPVVPGDSTPRGLVVLVRRDEQGRYWWPDWKRAPVWKGAYMGRLAPPRSREELEEMLSHENPAVRERALELVPEMP